MLIQTTPDVQKSSCFEQLSMSATGIKEQVWNHYHSSSPSDQSCHKIPRCPPFFDCCLWDSNVWSSKTYGNIDIVIGDSVQCNVHGVLGEGSETDQRLQEISDRSCWSTVMVDLASNNDTRIVDDRCTLFSKKNEPSLVTCELIW